jgi:hypothetical protein
MRGCLRYLLFLPVFALFACQSSNKKDTSRLDTQTKSDTLATLENDSVKLTFSLLGGSLIDFESKSQKINPFLWKDDGKDSLYNSQKTNILPQGQFISFNRWGKPTPGETKQGMPANGELAYNWWKLDQHKKEGSLQMSCEAPMDGFSISRNVALSNTDPLFKVTETITNENPVGRPNCIVHNICFVAPFFDPALIINSNASVGFNQMLESSTNIRHEYWWPNAFTDTLKISSVNISSYSTRFSYLSSHIFRDSVGWVTIYNPRLKLLLGYIWKTTDYPWIHFKNEISFGKPHYQGFAFGNTGFSDKFSNTERIASQFHQVKNFEFIDAKSSAIKSWYCFLISLPNGYEKTIGIQSSDISIALKYMSFSGVKDVKLSL